MKDLLNNKTEEEVKHINTALRMCDIDINIFTTYKVLKIIDTIKILGVDNFGIREAITIDETIDKDIEVYKKIKSLDEFSTK